MGHVIKDKNEVLTVEQYMELDRQNAIRRTKNQTELYGFISKKTKSDPKPAMKDGVQQLNGDGSLRFYKPSMSITFDITGGSLNLQIEDESLFDSIDCYCSYLMTARHGEVRNFGQKETGLIPLKFEL